MKRMSMRITTKTLSTCLIFFILEIHNSEHILGIIRGVSPN